MQTRNAMGNARYAHAAILSAWCGASVLLLWVKCEMHISIYSYMVCVHVRRSHIVMLSKGRTMRATS